VYPNPSFTIADQLFWIVDCFCKTMAPEACKLRIGKLSIAVWNRVRGFERRFSKLYAMWKAGTLPKARGRAVADPSPRPTGSGPVAGPPPSGEAEAIAALGALTTRPASVLPRGLMWLQQTLPQSAGALRAGVESLLWNYPEMKEFVAACPQVARILRPMCRMAGMKAPEWLGVPRRVRRKDTSPRPSPHSGEGEGPLPAGANGGDGASPQRRRRRTPIEIADELVRRSERTGKPINIAKVAPVVWGCIVHRPRDGNCPPPEIGYGGRRRKPPKDYTPPWE
jgi:hypothetical protein